MKVCVSVDLDNYAQYSSLVGARSERGETSFYSDALPRFLELFDRCGIRATFFVIGRDAVSTRNRSILREAVERGHELGNHSHTHPYDFPSLTREQKLAEISQAEAAIADAVGERPVGFRTPSLGVDGETLSLLTERGYLYDSSIFPSPLMWAFRIYGALFVRHDGYSLGHPLVAIAPSSPYHPDLQRVYRPCSTNGDAPTRIVEIPISVVPVVRIPFYSTLLRMFGTHAFSLCARAHGRRRVALHTIFHLIELADFGGTALDREFKRMPGLNLTAARRMRFVERASEILTGLGEAVPLRELAKSFAAPSVAA